MVNREPFVRSSVDAVQQTEDEDEGYPEQSLAQLGQSGQQHLDERVPVGGAPQPAGAVDTRNTASSQQTEAAPREVGNGLSPGGQSWSASWATSSASSAATSANRSASAGNPFSSQMRMKMR